MPVGSLAVLTPLKTEWNLAKKIKRERTKLTLNNTLELWLNVHKHIL